MPIGISMANIWPTDIETQCLIDTTMICSTANLCETLEGQAQSCISYSQVGSKIDCMLEVANSTDKA